MKNPVTKRHREVESLITQNLAAAAFVSYTFLLFEPH